MVAVLSRVDVFPEYVPDIDAYARFTASGSPKNVAMRVRRRLALSIPDIEPEDVEAIAQQAETFELPNAQQGAGIVLEVQRGEIHEPPAISLSVGDDIHAGISVFQTPEEALDHTLLRQLRHMEYLQRVIMPMLQTTGGGADAQVIGSALQKGGAFMAQMKGLMKDVSALAEKLEKKLQYKGPALTPAQRQAAIQAIVKQIKEMRPTDARHVSMQKVMLKQVQQLEKHMPMQQHMRMQIHSQRFVVAPQALRQLNVRRDAPVVVARHVASSPVIKSSPARIVVARIESMRPVTPPVMPPIIPLATMQQSQANLSAIVSASPVHVAPVSRFAVLSQVAPASVAPVTARPVASVSVPAASPAGGVVVSRVTHNVQPAAPRAAANNSVVAPISAKQNQPVNVQPISVTANMVVVNRAMPTPNVPVQIAPQTLQQTASQSPVLATPPVTQAVIQTLNSHAVSPVTSTIIVTPPNVQQPVEARGEQRQMPNRPTSPQAEAKENPKREAKSDVKKEFRQEAGSACAQCTTKNCASCGVKTSTLFGFKTTEIPILKHIPEAVVAKVKKIFGINAGACAGCSGGNCSACAARMTADKGAVDSLFGDVKKQPAASSLPTPKQG